MKRFLVLFISFVAAHCFAQENVTFQRVDEAPANGDWSGEYLIGWTKTGIHQAYALNGAGLKAVINLTSSGKNNTVSIEPNVTQMTITNSNPTVIVEGYNNNYSIRTKSGLYIGTKGSTSILAENSPIENVFSYTNGFVKILSKDCTLMFSEGDTYFKYYSNNDASNIALYRATSYSRSGLTAGKMGTICLPSDATITGAKIYSILGTVMKEGNLDGLVLEEQTTAVAGTPYIFIAEGETMTATYSGATKSDPEVATGLVGNLNSATANVPTDCYVISNNQLRKVNGGTATIATHRAYLDLSEVPEYNDKPAKSVYWGADGVIVDDATAIENISTDIEVDECIYNINGIRVQEGDLAPGVYIKGKRTGSGIIGKKYVIK